jgi:hypothetical protein
MELAAELRAAGATWEMIGEKVKRHPNVVVRWTSVYRDEWQQLLRDAEERVARLGTHETRSTMRTLLRHEDLKIRLGAADQLTKLLRVELAQRKPADSKQDLTNLLAHVEEMSDEELEQCLAEFVELTRAGNTLASRQEDRHPAEPCEVGGDGVEGPVGAD